MKPEEFNHILLPMRSGLKLYAQRFTGDADDAEDLVQEALLRLWNMRSGLDLSRDVGPLARTIIHNLCLDKARHDRLCRSGGDGMEIAVDDLSAEAKDSVRLVGRIVGQLPPLQRQIFRMKEIEGHEMEEIMQIVGCSADNLRKNLSRARLRIREVYMRIMKGE